MMTVRYPKLAVMLCINEIMVNLLFATRTEYFVVNQLKRILCLQAYILLCLCFYSCMLRHGFSARTFGRQNSFEMYCAFWCNIAKSMVGYILIEKIGKKT